MEEGGADVDDEEVKEDEEVVDEEEQMGEMEANQGGN